MHRLVLALAAAGRPTGAGYSLIVSSNLPSFHTSSRSKYLFLCLTITVLHKQWRSGCWAAQEAHTSTAPVLLQPQKGASPCSPTHCVCTFSSEGGCRRGPRCRAAIARHRNGSQTGGASTSSVPRPHQAHSGAAVQVRRAGRLAARGRLALFLLPTSHWEACSRPVGGNARADGQPGLCFATAARRRSITAILPAPRPLPPAAPSPPMASSSPLPPRMASPCCATARRATGWARSRGTRAPSGPAPSTTPPWWPPPARPTSRPACGMRSMATSCTSSRWVLARGRGIGTMRLRMLTAGVWLQGRAAQRLPIPWPLPCMPLPSSAAQAHRPVSVVCPGRHLLEAVHRRRREAAAPIRPAAPRGAARRCVRVRGGLPVAAAVAAIRNSDGVHSCLPLCAAFTSPGPACPVGLPQSLGPRLTTFGARTGLPTTSCCSCPTWTSPT